MDVILVSKTCSTMFMAEAKGVGFRTRPMAQRERWPGRRIGQKDHYIEISAEDFTARRRDYVGQRVL